MLTPKPGQANLFNYINSLSQLPLQRFQGLHEEPQSIERYLGVVRREMATLLPPLGLQAQDLEAHLSEQGSFRDFFVQAEPEWMSVGDGEPAEAVIEDLGELHLSLYDAQHEFAEWNRLRHRYGEIPRMQKPSEALKVQLRRVEGAWSSRIQLAERAMTHSLSGKKSDETRVLSSQGIDPALGAYFDAGMRLEFTVLTAPESIQYYYSG